MGRATRREHVTTTSHPHGAAPPSTLAAPLGPTCEVGPSPADQAPRAAPRAARAQGPSQLATQLTAWQPTRLICEPQGASRAVNPRTPASHGVWRVRHPLPAVAPRTRRTPLVTTSSPYRTASPLPAGIFVAGGLQKIPAFDGLSAVVGSKIGATTGYAPTPEVAKLALAIAIFLEAVGGLAFVAGAEKLGAQMVVAFLAAITPIMHNPRCVARGGGGGCGRRCGPARGGGGGLTGLAAPHASWLGRGANLRVLHSECAPPAPSVSSLLPLHPHPPSPLRSLARLRPRPVQRPGGPGAAERDHRHHEERRAHRRVPVRHRQPVGGRGEEGQGELSAAVWGALGGCPASRPLV